VAGWWHAQKCSWTQSKHLPTRIVHSCYGKAFSMQVSPWLALARTWELKSRMLLLLLASTAGHLRDADRRLTCMLMP
jgi:hypothetical protein